MVVELIFKDGRTQIVERCFQVDRKKRNGEWVTHIVAQRAPGTKVRWYKPDELEHANYERPDLVPSNPRKAG